MVLIDDDSILHPTIPEDIQLYISCLNEGHVAYERYFDALLVKRSQHESFFHDLRMFREQARVINLLNRAGDDKSCYREVTNVFLDSRFAHPWCRRNAHKRGFWRSQWGNIQGKPKSAAVTKEELQLHKLLLPIWIVMRSRMLRDQDIVAVWYSQEMQRRADAAEQQRSRLTVDALKVHDQHYQISGKSLLVPHVKLQSVSETGLDEQDRQRQLDQAATRAFKLAATGMLLSTTPKRKLRWLAKSPT